MLSSANYVRDERIINTGEQIAPDLNLKDPNVRVYYHQVKGARTHLPDGAEIVFMGGQFSTGNQEIIAFMDKIADKRGTMIYTKNPNAIVQEFAQVATEAANPAGDAAKQNTPVSEEMLKTVTRAQPRPEALPSTK